MKKYFLTSALALFFLLSHQVTGLASSRSQVVSFAEHLAKRGESVDFDGQFGAQCADLITFISHYYFDKTLTGNAIDFLKSAEAVGFETVSAKDYQPQIGDVFVMASQERLGHPYGHTGLIIGKEANGRLLTVEQNIGSEATALTQGGPARFNFRQQDDTSILGYIRLPYQLSLPETLPTSGRFRSSTQSTIVYTQPHITSPVLTEFPKGRVLRYKELLIRDQILWVRMTLWGKERYMPIGVFDDLEQLQLFGEVT